MYSPQVHVWSTPEAANLVYFHERVLEDSRTAVDLCSVPKSSAMSHSFIDNAHTPTFHGA